MRVYSLLYEDSIEQEQFANAKRREIEAFEKLVRLKKDLVRVPQ